MKNKHIFQKLLQYKMTIPKPKLVIYRRNLLYFKHHYYIMKFEIEVLLGEMCLIVM